MLSQQFRDNTLSKQKQLWNENDAPFCWQHNFPKRKVGNERVNPRQVDKKPEVPKQRERGLEFSRRRKKQTFFSFSTQNIIFFKPGTDDYTTNNSV